MEFQRQVSIKWNKHLDLLVSGSQTILFRYLEEKGAQNASTLAKQLRITPGAFTSLSDKLIPNVCTKGGNQPPFIFGYVLQLVDAIGHLVHSFAANTF